MGAAQCIITCVPSSGIVGAAVATAGYCFGVPKSKFRASAGVAIPVSLVIFAVLLVVLELFGNLWSSGPNVDNRPDIIWNNSILMGGIAGFCFAVGLVLGFALCCYGGTCCQNLDDLGEPVKTEEPLVSPA
jgi:hypothetical protein